MQKTEIPKDNNTKIISMHDEMSSSYLSYAMSVIVSRALPDIRDGLKPVHRRILFAMYKGGYDWSKQFRKSARIVGDVIGKYHPHGDQSVYDALVRMVQDFSMSLPLVEGQGNFGSIDGDPAAAMRYTETRLSKVSQFLIDDIEKNTVSYKSNYDETEKEPTVLPAQYPNLLVNGAGGIAVGMATSIPPHNLGEIINGTLALIENKDIKIKDLMKHIPGPDFPTGGIIIGKDIIKQGYNSGRGSFKIRGEISTESLKNGKDRLIITSVPYQVNKSILNERIAQLVREKKIEGIKDRAHILIGLSVSVENLDKIIKIIRSSKTPDEAKKALLKTKWKISKSLKLISLIEGKKGKNLYSFTEPQVISILELRLQKLTALGINEIEIEIKKLAELITNYKKIINSKKTLLKVISEELKTIKEKFSVPRRTKIIDAVLNYDIEETIQNESVIITVTLQGYIKRGALSSVKQQKRGGKGKSGITTREEDSVVQTLSVSTHTSVLFFSTEGLVYKIKAWKIPEGSTTSKGKSLFNILPLKNHQSISSIMPFPEEESEWKDLQIVFATAQGKVRKNSLSDFLSINAAGKIAMKLDSNDKIVGVIICKNDQDVMLSTRNGKCIRFESNKLRIFKGRSSKGIKGINLAPKDEIVSLSIVDQNKNKKNGKISKDEKSEIISKERFILSITENGYGKKTSHYDYRVTNRGGKGIIGIINSPRNGSVASSFPVYDGDEIMISTNKGRVIRVAVKEIRSAGRNTQGVRIIKLSGDEKVVSAIKIDDNLV